MILIRGAEVYDPANGLDGQIRDLWVDGERIAAAPAEPDAQRVIDARGMIVAPAGVEIHTHVAGYGLNVARRFFAGDAGLLETLTPPAARAAQRYLELGYTTVFDAASSPAAARLTAADLCQMGGVDRGTFTQLGDHRLLLSALADGDLRKARDVLAWLLRVSGGYALKLVNPGGGIAWKMGQPAPGLDDPVGLGSLTQRQIIKKLARLARELDLPHPLHLHAGRLGRPGNSAHFCQTAAALDGLRAHLCHIQFYAYGRNKSGGFTSAAERIVGCLQKYPLLTSDIGAVVFGAALAVSADTSGIFALQKATASPWISRQVEGEGGINALCLSYKPASAASVVQWATGLELLLLNPDPKRLFLTTDHPNGAPFCAYPQLIEWLMSKPARQEMLARCHPAAVQRSGLAGIEREYRLGEIFTMTSWGPARALGLYDRGHLKPGALANLRCYRKNADVRAMFAAPAWVMRRGRVVAADGQALDLSGGDRLAVRPPFDEHRLPQIYSELGQLVSIPPEEYGLGSDSQPEAVEAACTSTTS